MERDRCFDPLEPYQCHLCNFSTNYITYIRNHRRYCDSNMRNCLNLCNSTKTDAETTLDTCKCDHTYATRFRAQIQRKPKTPICPITIPKWYKCGECNFKTVKEYEMRQHKRKSHALLKNQKLERDVKLLTCLHCSFLTSEQSAFKAHLISAHTRSLKFKCHRCHFQSNDKHDFKHHLFMHVKPLGRHMCDMCGACFVVADALRQHRIDKHGLEDPIKSDFPEV